MFFGGIVLFFSLFWVRFFGLLGMRATYGTINNGIGVVLMGMMRPEMKMKCIVLVIMARMLGYAHFDWYAN